MQETPPGGNIQDGHLGLVVGDATAKGVPAALVMARARSMLRAVAQVSQSPGAVLRSVNDPLVNDIPPTCLSPASTPSSTQRAAP
jgi:phosphoserine phosphatase RsbU/P